MRDVCFHLATIKYSQTPTENTLPNYKMPFITPSDSVRLVLYVITSM